MSLINDVTSYFNHKGSPLFVCSLDADGAFDGIPHPILLKKTDIIPDHSWKLLHNWYCNITVKVKWNKIGDSTNVCKATRQGGLTSCFMFNLFYKDMIDDLECQIGGCSIDNMSFNVVCLQRLIHCADNYVTNHGLKFNPEKSKCMIAGKNPFMSIPEWFIGNKSLELCDNLEYLGGFIGNGCNNVHVNVRIRQCRKAFYALQSVHVFNSTCRSVLIYGCDTMFLSKVNRTELDKCQSKLIKCIVSLNPRHRSKPLLQALNVHNISKSVDFNTISLLHNIFRNSSGASKFYTWLLNEHLHCPKLLTSRVKQICQDHDYNFLKACISEDYHNEIKCKMFSKVKNGDNGTVDSIRHLLKCRLYD